MPNQTLDYRVELQRIGDGLKAVEKDLLKQAKHCHGLAREADKAVAEIQASQQKFEQLRASATELMDKLQAEVTNVATG